MAVYYNSKRKLIQEDYKEDELCVFFFTWESEEVEWFLCSQLIYSKETESQSFWREEGWQVHVLQEHEVRIQGPRDQIFAHTLTQLSEQGHRYSINVSWNCTFFLPFPSSNYLNKQRNCIHLNEIHKGLAYLFVTSLHSTHTHTRTHTHTHTLTHTHMHRKALEFKCIHFLRKNEGRRTSKDKKLIQEALGNRSVCSLLLWVLQTKQRHICICLFV